MDKTYCTYSMYDFYSIFTIRKQTRLFGHTNIDEKKNYIQTQTSSEATCGGCSSSIRPNLKLVKLKKHSCAIFVSSIGRLNPQHFGLYLMIFYLFIYFLSYLGFYCVLAQCCRSLLYTGSIKKNITGILADFGSKHHGYH